MPCPPPGDLPNPGIKPRSPALQADSSPSEPPGKSRNTGVGSLSLLQGIFLTKKLNWGLLHFRWILYQLSHLGSPILSLCECFYAFPLECKLYESRNNFIYNYMIVESHSRVRLFATPWTVAHQAPRSMGLSRHEYWSGLPFPSPGDLPNPGIESGSPAL